MLISVAVLVIGIVIGNYMMTTAYNENISNKQLRISDEATLFNERLERAQLFSQTVESMRTLYWYATETFRDYTWAELWQLRTRDLGRTLFRIISTYSIVDSAVMYVPNDRMRPIPPYMLNIASLPPERAQVINPAALVQSFHLRDGEIVDTGSFDEWVFYFTHFDDRLRVVWIMEVYLDIDHLFWGILGEGESAFVSDSNIIIHSENSYDFLQQLAAGSHTSSQLYNWESSERIAVWASLALDFAPGIQLARVHYTAEINQQMSNIRLMIIISLVLLMVIVTGFITLITNIMFKRLNVVVNAMKRVEEGDIFFIAPSTVDDEISIMTDGFNRMMNNLLSHFSVSIRRQAAAKDAEIQALLNQINSHFLYNVLDSFKCMAEINYNYELADAIVAFARITRYNVDKVRRHTTIEDETEYINNYVTLVNVRKENAICYKCVVDPAIKAEKIMKMIIQPFVENSITHGFIDFDGEKRHTLLLKITKENNKIHIMIADNGVGMGEEMLDKIRQYFNQIEVDKHDDDTIRQSVGIQNTCYRIKLEYGDNAHFDIQSKTGFYTRVLITL